MSISDRERIEEVNNSMVSRKQKLRHISHLRDRQALTAIANSRIFLPELCRAASVRLQELDQAN